MTGDVVASDGNYSLAFDQLDLEHHHALFPEGHFRRREIELPHSAKAVVVEVFCLFAPRHEDQEIDALNTSLFRELLTHMMENPRNITFCTHMLFCAKNIERMGDHATNIAESVYYIVEGRALPEERPKADVTSKKALPQSA
jgi:hypothetical protein